MWIPVSGKRFSLARHTQQLQLPLSCFICFAYPNIGRWWLRSLCITVCLISSNTAEAPELKSFTKTYKDEHVNFSQVTLLCAYCYSHYQYYNFNICLSVCPSACLPSDCRFACLSVCLSSCLTVCFSVCQAVCLFVCLCICLSVFCLSVGLSVCVAVCSPLQCVYPFHIKKTWATNIYIGIYIYMYLNI